MFGGGFGHGGFGYGHGIVAAVPLYYGVMDLAMDGADGAPGGIEKQHTNTRELTSRRLLSVVSL
ncbi:hypothetical protein ANCCEY_04642 [Ancylostoma ceylanicum]|uniref:Uncharacterized protein n=1 Tax=Ancylostoma ceylanicum TaxID=53326 RepID=A0A0D6LW59_9BILA|nr:hypothetical protein ANCCEY_04642 [Ancylostoma ceylanicum]